MNNKILIAALLFLGIISTNVKSQTKYWVKFKNKNGTPYTVSNPSAFLTAKSIQRRTTYSITVNQSDLPVTPSYISQVEAVPNVTVLYASKWINGVVVAVTNTAALSTINSFSFVASSAPVNRLKLSIPKIEEPGIELNKAMAAPASTINFGGSYWQSNQLGVDCIHSQGYRGQGMTIAVLDAGFLNVNTNPVFDSLKNRGGILGTRDFVSGNTNVYDDDSHGASVLSCMAAIKPGVIMGTAPRADYWLLRTEDNASPNPLNETPSEEYNWIRGAEFADSVGVDIITTSLGYSLFDNSSYNHSYSQLNGKTLNMSIAATMAARKGIFVLNSAGNEGANMWMYITVPADADSICTVGAIDSLSNVASFSSVGPTSDGRIKPDLVARGAGSYVSYSNGVCGQSNGTSFSCPILAGAVACYWQKHISWNNMKVLDTLKKTASNAGSPNNQRGWGTPNMCGVIAGVKESASQPFNMSVAPNPFNSQIQLNFSNYTSFNTRLEIYDNLGKLVMAQNLENNRLHFETNLSTIPNGIYFLKISSDQGSVVKKIIKH